MARRACGAAMQKKKKTARKMPEQCSKPNTPPRKKEQLRTALPSERLVHVMRVIEQPITAATQKLRPEQHFGKNAQNIKLRVIQNKQRNQYTNETPTATPSHRRSNGYPGAAKTEKKLRHEKPHTPAKQRRKPNRNCTACRVVSFASGGNNLPPKQKQPLHTRTTQRRADPRKRKSCVNSALDPPPLAPPPSQPPSSPTSKGLIGLFFQFSPDVGGLGFHEIQVTLVSLRALGFLLPDGHLDVREFLAELGG